MALCEMARIWLALRISISSASSAAICLEEKAPIWLDESEATSSVDQPLIASVDSCRIWLGLRVETIDVMGKVLKKQADEHTNARSGSLLDTDASLPEPEDGFPSGETLHAGRVLRPRNRRQSPPATMV